MRLREPSSGGKNYPRNTFDKQGVWTRLVLGNLGLVDGGPDGRESSRWRMNLRSVARPSGLKQVEWEKAKGCKILR